MQNSQNRHNFALFHKTVLNNPYIKSVPTDKQAEFLLNAHMHEGFYGGAAGGGKSEALLMGALQFVDQPGYAALILRLSYADLSLPGALLDRTAEWLADTDAKWRDKTKTWEFPSGATLTFGYLEHEKDKYRYQGAEFQYVAFDELTQFTETKYQYLFSRTRRLKGSTIPIRIRSASNPGGIGHDWTKLRFITPNKVDLVPKGRYFISAKLEDNPFLDRDEYEGSLDKLDPVTFDQLRHGDWDVSVSGGMFKYEWFKYHEGKIPKGPQVRYWDLAATELSETNDPDYTVGALMSTRDGKYYIKDIIRVRAPPGEIEKIVKQTALNDGLETKIVIEQEPGSSGIYTVDNFTKNILRGYSAVGVRSTGSKIVRAQPLSAAVFNGHVMIKKDSLWAPNMVYEFVRFPNPSLVHDDQVDAVSGAYNTLAGNYGSSYAGLGLEEDIISNDIPSLDYIGNDIPGL